MKLQTISKRRRQVLMMGAGTVAAPAMAMPVIQGTWTQTGVEAVVSGQVLSAVDGESLAGAQIEIWNDAVRVTATTDGDGRYFVTVSAAVGTSKLNYRVTHLGHTAQITQLRLGGAQQRRVTRVCDESGTTRAAFELALSLPAGISAFSPEAVIL